jgi:hypothetical protein
MGNYYYACIEYTDGVVVKIPYEKREDARNHINISFEKPDVKACWTE